MYILKNYETSITKSMSCQSSGTNCSIQMEWYAIRQSCTNSLQIPLCTPTNTLDIIIIIMIIIIIIINV